MTDAPGAATTTTAAWDSASHATNDPATAAITRRQITAAVAGNALEFYDFTTYALFAVEIGHTFFPADSAFKSLMASLLTFAIGFVGRPIGAIVLGRYGDRAGRKPAMLLSFMLMGLGILGIVLTPSYAAIGWAAPVLLLAFRLLQGFALGGEVGPTTAFLIESAPLNKRGLIGAWQSGSQAIASLTGATVGLLLTHVLTPDQLQTYGWRIAFGLGAIVLPFGLILRRSLPETLHRHEAKLSIHPTAHGPFSHARPILLGLGMIMSFTTSTYVLLYMTTFASETLHMTKADAFGASVANGLAGVIFALAGGALSDRFGRKPVMITARVLFLLAIFPAYTMLVENPNVITLIAVTGLLSALSSISVGVALVCLTESLRKDVRSTGLAVVYAVGVAVFGGIVQPSSAWLVKVTGNPLALAWYMMAAAAIGIVAMSFMRETAPTRLEQAVPVELT